MEAERKRLEIQAKLDKRANQAESELERLQADLLLATQKQRRMQAEKRRLDLVVRQAARARRGV